MCFIIIHKVITITEMKMNYFGKNYFSVQSIICLFRMKQLPGPLIHIHPHPHPPPPFLFLRKAFLAPAVAKFQSIIESLQQFYLTGYNFGFLVLETLSHVT